MTIISLEVIADKCRIYMKINSIWNVSSDSFIRLHENAQKRLFLIGLVSVLRRGSKVPQFPRIRIKIHSGQFNSRSFYLDVSFYDRCTVHKAMGNYSK